MCDPTRPAAVAAAAVLCVPLPLARAVVSAVPPRPGHVQLPSVARGGDVVQGQGQHEERGGEDLRMHDFDLA